MFVTNEEDKILKKSAAQNLSRRLSAEQIKHMHGSWQLIKLTNSSTANLYEAHFRPWIAGKVKEQAISRYQVHKTLARAFG
ncbi:hypothetical protein ACET3Z_032321 [Daucus carota]